MDVCYCGMCWRWGGGFLLVIYVVEVVFEGEDVIFNYVLLDWV